MPDLLLAAAFAALLWWFTTGVVLLLDGLPRASFRWSLAAASVLALAALAVIDHAANDRSAAGAYAGFTAAIVVWGWQELAFLTGAVTGPRRHACAAGCHGRAHFRHAVEAILWHEIAIIGGALLIAALTHDAAQPVALWTYVVLWVMRTSAKLNLFLGVRNLSEQFLPPHLAYLQSFFRRAPMNLLFPLSVGAGTAVAALLAAAAVQPAVAEGRAVGLVLVAALLALAVLEHWLMVLPVSADALWRWAMRASGRALPPAPEPAALALDAHADTLASTRAHR